MNLGDFDCQITLHMDFGILRRYGLIALIRENNVHFDSDTEFENWTLSKESKDSEQTEHLVTDIIDLHHLDSF